VLFRFLPYLLFLLPNTIVLAQTNSLAMAYGIGYTIPNHPDFPEVKGPSNSIELGWSHKQNAFWSLLNGGAVFHLNATFQNFGNNAVLGQAFALTPAMSYPIVKKRQFSMQLHLGWGAAWISKKFDSFSNSTNIVIGTNLNASVSAMLEFTYSIKSLEPFLGLKVQHYSNGNAMSPNLGINMPMLQTGLRFMFENEIKSYDLMRGNYKKSDSTFAKYEFPKPKIPFRPFFQLGLGLSANIQRGPFFPVYNLNAGAQWLYRPSKTLWAGIEYSFNSAVYEFYQNNGSISDPRKFNRYAIWLGHEWIFGRVGFFALGGLYLNRHVNQRSLFPTQTGINFYPRIPYFKPRHQFWIGVHIRAYLGLADYVMLQAGYRF
jgi:hypothetical protein